MFVLRGDCMYFTCFYVLCPHFLVFCSRQDMQVVLQRLFEWWVKDHEGKGKLGKISDWHFVFTDLKIQFLKT